MTFASLEICSTDSEELGTVVVSDFGDGRYLQEIHGGEFDGSARVIQTSVGLSALQGLDIINGTLVGYSDTTQQATLDI